MTNSQRHESWLIDKIDKKHVVVVPVGKAKEQQFARKCGARWSKTHIVSVTVKRRRKVVA